MAEIEVEPVPSRIRRLRTEMGWSQLRLAVQARINQRTLAKGETEGGVNEKTLRLLAAALRIPEKFLLAPKATEDVKIARVRDGQAFFAALVGSDVLDVDVDDGGWRPDHTVELVAQLLDQVAIAKQWDLLSFGSRYREERRTAGIMRLLNAESRNEPPFEEVWEFSVMRWQWGDRTKAVFRVCNALRTIAHVDSLAKWRGLFGTVAVEHLLDVYLPQEVDSMLDYVEQFGAVSRSGLTDEQAAKVAAQVFDLDHAHDDEMHIVLEENELAKQREETMRKWHEFAATMRGERKRERGT